MILLNLLPPQKKKEAEEKILYAAIKNILAVFLVFLIFVSVILLGGKLILARNFQTVVEQTTLIVKEYGGINKKIKETNDKLASISDAQNEFIEWSPRILKISEAIPENIQITTIVLRDGKNKTLLKGIAKTRDDLLILRVNLEESDLFSRIELPFSNLLKREGVDFEFQLTFK